MKDQFSPIYFDDLPIRLLGDEARPPLSRIVRAGGQIPGRVDVVVLSSPQDAKGHLLPPGEVIDRTVEPTKPIYLRSIPKPADEVRGMQDRDPVIAQLGTEPRYLTKAKPMADVATVDPADRDERAMAEAQALAVAEAEAEARQEEDREQDGEAQDDLEAERDARDDLDDQD